MSVECVGACCCILTSLGRDKVSYSQSLLHVPLLLAAAALYSTAPAPLYGVSNPGAGAGVDAQRLRALERIVQCDFPREEEKREDEEAIYAAYDAFMMATGRYGTCFFPFLLLLPCQ